MHPVINLTCPPIHTVRIALIGLGHRGLKTLARYADVEGAEIRYIADLRPERLKIACDTMRAAGREVPARLEGENGWKEALNKTDVDLVYICTEWRSHTPMAVAAMRAGKHVAVEVPAATTIDECYALVETARETGRHCFMTENCCYDLFHLQTLALQQSGKFGVITHCEGAYIHDLQDPAEADATADTREGWIEQQCMAHGGNPYPTHGIGPIGQLLGFHRRDRMTRLTSLTSRGVENDGTTLGRINSSLIETASGATILLQLDVTTPRPYSRLQTVCGTAGYAQKYPVPTLQFRGEEALTGQAATDYLRANASSSPVVQTWFEGHKKGVANEMNYAMDTRLIHCLREGLPLEIDVIDAAEWSCLAPLTRQSARAGGMPVEIPDFTLPR